MHNHSAKRPDQNHRTLHLGISTYINYTEDNPDNANVTPESDGRSRKTPSKVADALSRTILPDPECAIDNLSDSLGDITDDQGSKP